MACKGSIYWAIVLFFIWNSSEGQIQESALLEAITIDDGLSQGYISCIIQDKKGFMWFGTLGGLNRYDGYDFQVYQFQPNQANTLSGNNISAIYEDREGLIWIGTWGQGVNVLDPTTEKVYQIVGEGTAYNQLSQLHTSQFLQDVNGDLWIGGQTPSSLFGLFRVKWDTEKLHETRDHQNLFDLEAYQLEQDTLPQNNDIFDLHIDNRNRLWVGTGLGLYSADINLARPIFELHNPYQYSETLPYSGVFSILQEDDLLWLGRSGTIQTYSLTTGQWGGRSPVDTSQKQVWVGQLNLDLEGRFWFVDRWGQGLYMIEKDSLHFGKTFPQPIIKAINAVFVDASNVIWMGRTARGIYKFSPQVNQFSPIDGLFTAQQEAYINHIHEDSEGRLWANNHVIDRKTVSWHKPRFIEKRLDGFRFMAVSPNGTFWAMSKPGELWAFNPTTELEHFFRFEENATPDGPIYPETPHKLWWGSRGILHRYDSGSTGITSFPFNTQATANPVGTFNFIIKRGKAGYLWLGTQQGLVRFDEANETFEIFRHSPHKLGSLSGDRVLTVLDDLEEPMKYLWVGTEGGGLNRVNKATGLSEHFTTQDGLPDNTIYGILPDDTGHLWLSTNRGLSKFNPKTGVFRNFDEADGLQNNEFNRMAYFKSTRGELFFAGVSGINAFYPDEIKDNDHVPNIAITEFRVGNQKISHFDTLSPLNRTITATDEIKLKYDQNMISFAFAALDYVNPGKNRYAYQMEGLSDQWIDAGNRRLANFTNLDPGTYVFRVKGSNNDGLWNEEGASIKIIISPPLWQTWWAYVVYLLLALSIISVIIIIQVRRARLRNQLLVEQQNSLNLRELEQMKSRFFSNITHEFRTPLTLILGPVEEMIHQNKKEKTLGSLRTIQRQAKHLLKLINELLDISKLESGRMELVFNRGDIVGLIKQLTDSFLHMAEHRGIRLNFQAESNELYFDFDSEKIKKIVSNLISNALKFTPSGGSVNVKVSNLIMDPNPQIALAVNDSGQGISTEDLPFIFDRFYQTKQVNSKKIHGSGIGLALAKELAQAMGGNIYVKSHKDVGSEFTLIIPYHTEKASSPLLSPGTDPPPETTPYNPLQNPEPVITSELASHNCELVLLVEDHEELRAFIKGQLQTKYKVIECSNGREGLLLAQQKIPDLIITDLMMPVLDGHEFCKRLKLDESTSHIPVIMLTAKSAMESRLQGLEEGAEAYLTKPFNREELLVRIRKLLEGRKHLQEKYQKLGKIHEQPYSNTALSREHTYLTKAEGVVEKFLDDPNFDVEAFCLEMGMSRTQLHRKLKALTNQSTTGFVRNIRLKTAMQLLERGAGNVTEVAYAVGFSSQTYFSKCFQEKFGMAPSQVRSGS